MLIKSHACIRFSNAIKAMCNQKLTVTRPTRVLNCDMIAKLR